MPYSDNLYSAVEDEWDEPSSQNENQGLGAAYNREADQEAAIGSADGLDVEDPYLLSPTDGYFGNSGHVSAGTGLPASSRVPYVPNVLVEDPSLQRSTAEGKAREAEEERRRNGGGASDRHDGHSAANPLQTAAAASRNGFMSAYALPPAPQGTASSSESAAAAYDTSSTSISTTTTTSYTPYATRRTAYHGDRFPLLPREAPPAYTPSPISPSSSQGPGGALTNYSTFSHVTDRAVGMGLREEESQGLLAHHPESMGNPDPDGLRHAAPTTWRDRVRRVAPWIKVAALALVLLLLTGGFLAGAFAGTRGQPGRNGPPVDRFRPQPGLPKPGDPAMSYPDIDRDFAWAAASTCAQDRITRPTRTFDLDFGADKQLGLVERTSDEDGRRGWTEVHVQGAVNVRRAGSDTPRSAVTVEITVNDDRLNVDTLWDGAAQVLKMIVPHRVEWAHENARACVNVKATVWVPEDSKLHGLDVDAVHLDINLLDNLFLAVSERTKLSSVVGSVTAASTGSEARDDQIIDGGVPASFNFYSRVIQVKTTAADIGGGWPLYDYLGLESTAGNVRVFIQPKDADPKTPAPAVLYIKSLSGTVEFREPTHAAEHAFRIGRQQAGVNAESLLPPRDYRVDVHTTSGDVTCAAAFSSSASFKSTSGRLSLDLLPVLDKSLAEPGSGVTLQTWSTSGTTNVKVLDPLWVDAATAGGALAHATYVALKKAKAAAPPPSSDDDARPPLRCLYGSHSTTSADIRLRYPGSWEGDIALTSMTGELRVDGKGVKVIKAGSDWPGINKSLLARKGEQGVGARIAAKSTSADVELVVGEKGTGTGTRGRRAESAAGWSGTRW